MECFRGYDKSRGQIGLAQGYSLIGNSIEYWQT